jgi:hypothetical protein
MTNQALLNQFQNLPAELQQQVLDYIEFLTEKYRDRLSAKHEADDGEAEAAERLKIALPYEGAAPFPDTQVSKYDWYEQ